MLLLFFPPTFRGGSISNERTARTLCGLIESNCVILANEPTTMEEMMTELIHWMTNPQSPSDRTWTRVDARAMKDFRGNLYRITRVDTDVTIAVSDKHGARIHRHSFNVPSPD